MTCYHMCFFYFANDKKTFLPNKQRKCPEGFFAFKCPFVDLLKQSRLVMSQFDSYTMRVLRHTAFYHFFSTISEGKIEEQMVDKCYNSIYQLLITYKHKSGGFVLNPLEQSKCVKLTPRLTSLVFGISMRRGETKELDKACRDNCEMYSRFFKGKKSVSRKEIREAMEGLQGMKCLCKADKVNLVKLLIMYSFSAVFFSSTSSIVTKSMMAKFDSIKTLNEVCWPKEITKRLLEQVVRYRKRPKSVSGCVYLMLYMLVEHTNVIPPLGSEQDLFPRMLKWDLSKVTSDNWTVIQKKLIMAEVKVDVDNISETEYKLLEGEEELSEVVVTDDEVEIFEVSQQEHEADKNPLDALCQAAFNDGRDSTNAGEMAAASERVEMQKEELVKNVIEHGEARQIRERNERRMNRKMKREKKEGDGYVEGVQRKEADDKMKRIKELERENSELKLKAAESTELYLKLKEETDITNAINQDKIKILMNDKDRILGKLKKAENVAAENRLLQIKVDNLDNQINANTTEPLLASPLRVVAAEKDYDDKTDKKEYPLSSIKTRSKRLLEQKDGKRKATCLDEP